jgi:hypothetical protein
MCEIIHYMFVCLDHLINGPAMYCLTNLYFAVQNPKWMRTSNNKINNPPIDSHSRQIGADSYFAAAARISRVGVGPLGSMHEQVE